MTCHVALSCADCAICFADSQGTSRDTESHGSQKIFVGHDFSIGIAGSGAIGFLLFEHLRRAVDASLVDANNLREFVKDFLDDEIQPHMIGNIQFITATPDSSGSWIQIYYPELFKNFSSRETFGSIGSGSEFTNRTFNHSIALGYGYKWGTAATSFTMAMELMAAADESLTVDNLYMVSICKGGRSYLLGDKNINPPRFAIQKTRENWPHISQKYAEIKAISETIISERRNAYQNVGNIADGTLTTGDVARLSASNISIASNLVTLDQKLTDFFKWRDSL